MHCHPERSEGSADRERSFAPLRMTGPVLIIKVHHVAATAILMPHYFLGRLFLIEVRYEEAH
jgi:hypothetical protein